MIPTKENLSQPVPELKTSEDRYLKMLEQIQDYAIIVLDKNGIVQHWNIGAEKIKGYKPSEIIGKSFRVFYRKEDLEEKLPDRLLKQAADAGRVTHEGWRVKKDGTYFWSSVTLTALHDDQGEITGFLKITKDLTEQKLANDKLHDYAAELSKRNEELVRSEERYHQMIDEVEDYAIILLDVDGHILHWNKGAERIKGYTAAEAIGQSFTIFYAEEDKMKGLPYRLLGEAREKGRVHHEGWRVRKDRTKFWGTVVITALHNSAGEVIGFSKVTRDLTKRKYAEEELINSKNQLQARTRELEQSEERYHRMVEEVQDYAIILLDKDGKILNWNKGAEKIKGYRPEEIIGQNFTVFYTPEDRIKGVPFSLLKEAALTGRAEQEGWRVRKDRTKFWGSIVITALHDKHNDLIGFSKVTRDLTERKMAEETLKQYLEKLERNNEELEQFAYVASHDLKEPLRKIITFGNLLEISAKESLDEKSKDYVSRMQGSASRMMSLIEDLLNFSRVNRPSEGFELVDVNQVINRVLSDLEVLINSRNVRMEIGKLPQLEGRKSQLGQLFQNLISNAVKFNDKKEPVVSITGTIFSEEPTANKFAKIEIRDNGIGFENIYSQRIFEIFQRLHGKSEYPGTGIGLAICKKIVEAHGGTISAEGSLGEGATFTLIFPFHSTLE
jgi:PAS domain S-box-containing protein